MTLVLDDVAARYGAGVHALAGVSLTVSSGAVTAVLGPNGAGKSTLVRCVAGLHPHTGTITLDGTLLRSERTRDRRRAGLASVTDRRDLVPSLSVERYLGLVLTDDDRARAFDLFPVLRNLRARPCGLLSGGEAQMLALARAFASRPKAVVLDEISQGLAPAIVAQLLPAVRQVADAGAAVLLVEQFAEAAARVADTVVLLDQGHVAYEGPVADAPLMQVYLRA